MKNKIKDRLHSFGLSVISLLWLVAVGNLLFSCARMGNPDGGWYDEEPPYVVATAPMENAINFHGKKIHLLFNEYIQLQNAQEKVVVSPPQIEQPEIKLRGNRITVELKDSLKANQTYTIDFSDAISDNNENNPMGNYTFTFSTYDRIDTMEVSGNVIDAETLEPVKSVLVGLYESSIFKEEKGDTIFRTQAMIRVARSDESGHFVIKGVARDKKYRIFALEDMDGTYTFSQQAEKIAFTDRIITTDCYPDTRQDTIWLDNMRIKDLVRVPYTHFTPDDVVMRLFQEKQTELHFLKPDRKEPEQLSVYFTYGHDSLPTFRPLDFEAKEGVNYIIEHSENKDTITYWLSDSLLINNDSLTVEMSFMDTDSLGVLQLKTDTIQFIPKIGFEKREKLKAEEYKKWKKEQDKLKKKEQPYETEMPRKPLQLKWNVEATMPPNKDITFTSPAPLAVIDTTKIRLTMKVDTTWNAQPFVLEKDSIIPRHYHIKSEWLPGKEYKLDVDSFAIRDIYDRLSIANSSAIKIGEEENYGKLIVTLTGVSGPQYIFQLLSKNNSIVNETVTKENRVEMKYLKTGEYYLKLIVDDDEDGKYTTGLYEDNRQPEAVYFYNQKLEIKEKWDKKINWNPTLVRLDKQKPAEIIKQKGEKKSSTRKDRNMQRARELGLKFLPDGRPVTEEAPRRNN